MVRPNHNWARNYAAWLAILAMALNGLWPLLANLRPGPAPQLAQLSSEIAMDHAEHHGGHYGGAGHQDSAPAEPSPLAPHCSFCSLAGGFTVLAAAPISIVVLLVAGDEFRPVLTEARPLALFAYSSGSPRAPPALS